MKSHNPVRVAALKGDVEEVAKLLEVGTSYEATTPISAISDVKESVAQRLLELFIEHGWDINSDHSALGTALTRSIDGNRKALVEFLVAHGADVNQDGRQKTFAVRAKTTLNFDSLGFRPLDRAAGIQSVEMIQYLLANGADLGMCNALHEAAGGFKSQPGNWIPVMQHLLDLGMDVNAIESYVKDARIPAGVRGFGTPLHYAARAGHTEIVNFLLEKGADPDIKGTENTGNALRWARNPPGDFEPDENPNADVIKALEDWQARSTSQPGMENLKI